MATRCFGLRSLAKCAALTLWVLISGVSAQQGREQAAPRGFPEDWSHHHIVFSRQPLWSHSALVRLEPRFVHQLMRQGLAAELGVAESTESFGLASEPTPRDWSFSLGTGRIAPGMSPAKFSFNPDAPPSCTADFVVVGLNVAGTPNTGGGQGNMIALTRLYSGTGGMCGNAGPKVLFAYNVTTSAGGRIATSPVLSEDGTKAAFIETTSTSAIFHVLTWASGAGNGVSATNSAVPGAGNTASMTSLTYAASDSDTRSSPWVDYVHDVAYVGSDGGKLYKITGVFHGTPALAGGAWPVTLTDGRRLTSPVFDPVSNHVFIGDALGLLWQVNATTPTTVKSLAVGLSTAHNPAILDGPIVDVDNGTVFATSANDGTSAVVVEADTTTLNELARARIGQGSAGATTVNLYDGNFNIAYFTKPSSGIYFTCGTGAADSTPWRYSFSFSGRVMKTTSGNSGQLLASTRARCSPMTEFFNKNIGPNGTDFFFFSLTADCTGANTSGCVMMRSNTGLIATVSAVGGSSAIVTDNNSTQGQASSIYFSNLDSPGFAVKVTQNGLQ